MSDTIAAIATGGGISAIGIIRISGGGAVAAADSVFRAINGQRLADAEDRRMYYGELRCANGRLIDLCLCVVSRGPGSYTGEDMVEFHCHGSPMVLSEALRALFSNGVRQALPGEFSKRAFLNGRMDLTQAEAVIDLIEAETPMAVWNAAGQLRGAVGLRLETIYSSLLDIVAHFHAVVDYPDEDIDDFKTQGYVSTLLNAKQELNRMLATYERGRVLRDGIPTAIIGRPNTGKSSLLNALLGYDRAIVTDLPGTTRDTIEEKIFFGGVVLRLIDTAGLRKTDSTVEKLGVERARGAMYGAGFVVLVLDGSEPLWNEDFEALRSIPADVPKIAAVNKSDLPNALDLDELTRLGIGYFRVSALTGAGLEVLDAEIRRMFPEPEVVATGEIITNARQSEAISRAIDSVDLALASVRASVTPDAILTDIEAALTAIGLATGKVMREDVMTRIFERFCVGK
ncbi:MAG: tRNA uridine-5-carboxymethylaminomethyl(34) synthesis GTPase MnmE [Oscillospiraceae bacterium]|nr:tRNA uridine-5-carboxymethylaminomethyl(34) synthesis GTPase MnmE [Oscillospiraceae bacterium]